jgi:hypothetical protein
MRSKLKEDIPSEITHKMGSSETTIPEYKPQGKVLPLKNGSIDIGIFRNPWSAPPTRPMANCQ